MAHVSHCMAHFVRSASGYTLLSVFWNIANVRKYILLGHNTMRQGMISDHDEAGGLIHFMGQNHNVYEECSCCCLLDLSDLGRIANRILDEVCERRI